MNWYNPSWQYRKRITISGSSGAGTNYQVLLKVGESYSTWQANTYYSVGRLVKPTAGSNSFFYECATTGISGRSEPTWPTTDGELWWDGNTAWIARRGLTLDGRSANFPADIRFTASDGLTLQDFWVEKVTGTPPNRVAYIWVKVSADLGSNRDIYCYYGNGFATNASNGTATFVLFDDFEDGDYNGWTWERYDADDTLSLETASPIEGAYSLKASQGAAWGYVKVYSGFINSVNVALKVKAKQTGYTYLDKGSGMGFVVMFYNDSNARLKSLVWLVYTTTKPEEHGDWVGEPHPPLIQRVDDWNLPENQIGERELIIANYAPTGATKIKIKAQIQSVDYGTFWTDLYRVRKYVSPEPAFSLAGSEETPNFSPFFLFFNN